MRRPSWNQLVAWAEREVARAREALPADVGAEAEGIPVTFEERPSEAMQEDPVVTPDILGLFLGGAFPDEVTGGGDFLPAQIVLFLGNLWDYAEGDARAFRAEVRRTYLHELGHYLGLDEDDLRRRDLD